MAPMKLAIIGGGPSAFYVASRILSLNSSAALRVHMYDRLWAPHGLVRYGVAPDHPEVKNCTNKFDTAASDSRFRFFGNVNVGGSAATNPLPHALHVPLQSVSSRYTHLLFATGCTQSALHEALPPSSHCVPALSFVHWYTQHPSNPPPPALENMTHVSLIGNGNVSLDVARMLLTSPSVLAKYDVPEHVLSTLSRSSVKHVSIIARRGPLEVAFTTKELRELITLPEASMIPLDPKLLEPNPDEPLTRQQSRIFQLLQKGSKMKPGTTPKTWSLDFFRSPTGLALPSPSSSSSLAQLSLAHTMVDPKTKRAVPTGDTTTLPTSLVVTSLGFRGEPAMPFFDPGLGHLRTVAGRIVDAKGRALPKVYASGWAAMGARGVLAATMMDAYSVADTMLGDLASSESAESGPSSAAEPLDEESPPFSMSDSVDLDDLPPEVEKGLREKQVVQYADWKAINEEETRRGESMQKERERMGWDEAHRFIS
ncbi:hypothetical protein HGRIS_010642 [Hohenbuehelia grisea]|uniref:NADPH:adrenodoxin oxidoreductase, mitochondrial n=1 Tax=Hohenbuehelia grisea TaxID=104357 RepID=A0ABR3IXC4_9AGAR